MIRSRYTAAITDKPWWLAGGIPAGSCVMAYQPIGASDYAASKVNLAIPGMYNAKDGAAYPTWANLTGWTFNGSTQYLTTGYIVPNNQTHSMFVRYIWDVPTGNSDAISFARTVGGANTCDFAIYIGSPTTFSYYSGSYVNQTIAHNSGTAGVAGNLGYFDGSAYATPITAGAGTQLTEQPIGCLMIADGTRSLYFPGKIQAYCIYSIALTQSQVAALTAAMNAL